MEKARLTSPNLPFYSFHFKTLHDNHTFNFFCAVRRLKFVYVEFNF